MSSPTPHSNDTPLNQEVKITNAAYEANVQARADALRTAAIHYHILEFEPAEVARILGDCEFNKAYFDEDLTDRDKHNLFVLDMLRQTFSDLAEQKM